MDIKLNEKQLIKDGHKIETAQIVYVSLDMIDSGSLLLSLDMIDSGSLLLNLKFISHKWGNPPKGMSYFFKDSSKGIIILKKLMNAIECPSILNAKEKLVKIAYKNEVGLVRFIGSHYKDEWVEIKGQY